ncbi:bifunctional aminotransferase class I/II-fold pyridoxal phosphate-dependent enzyme/GNAT family N-acetyltransferase [Gramella sp. GC03-9]|uniref:Bifunctional aminotransferase class I/II-fold pyridoxal phosphate-dependent enzyme/GNAT family N-acetyltransferase n=1 Tax=Christiangramia oceanisediminis TaxID=2920386 RepID=A0A9X2KZW7_9FLAO|nr:aminotransferase class I/II-fold pyridoxal phosphate-dependent enzyme [Gramella oceanisediminis]MCP9201312.1 bifunctional aminotransferase class I/II-fold pyridoxal phosphate-dependent enzyme/GNAT family N-acetyltransferase [Gramella oceanisediminis]
MAKIKHNNFLDTVVEVMTNAKDEGALHLYAEGESFNGRHIQIKGKKLFHFGTTGYLGLEQDLRLKRAAIDAIERYGTQFPLSKSYISHPLYEELEEKIRSIYGLPVIITKNSTLGHMAVIPSIVQDGDGIILDHQVHWSVQNAVQPLKLRSVPVEMIRHNRLDMLEDKIKKLSNRCNTIWYMADGIYSMYGDYAPIRELIELSVRYPQLHIYFDDVHGMSWKGKNGSGYVMSVLEELPENAILFGTLSKTFGASGAVMVCNNKKLHRRIRNFGGPLTFSAQLEPSSVGAAIASADIHLSPEIYELQQQLSDRTSYFNECLKATELPLISENDSPVFYIGTGMPETGYNLVNRLMGEGYYVNLGIFPAVPVKNTGLRITISRHNQKQEILGLTEAVNHHYYKALEETHTNLERVRFAFGMTNHTNISQTNKLSSLTCEIFTTIHDMKKEDWNKYMGNGSIIDWDGMAFIEKSFTGNRKPEHNYQFYYFNIKDSNSKVILMSLVTLSLWKEDMLAPISVTREMERLRVKDPYYHTSHILSLGSFLTEGDHLYLDRESKNWKEAFSLFLHKLEELENRLKPSTVLLRDFRTDDNELNDFLHNKGFVKVAMPESCVYENFTWNSEEEYVSTLSTRSRKHFRKEIQGFRDYFNISIDQSVNIPLLEKFYGLYLEVKKNNPGLNTFNYPFELFENMNDSKSWEFIILRLKKEENQDEPMVGVMFCYKNSSGVYVPDLIGMDYKYSRKYQVYRQLLYQTIIRAKGIKCSRIDFGLTAAFEKRKVGAKVIEKCAYLQTRDNYTLEALDWLRTD